MSVLRDGDKVTLDGVLYDLGIDQGQTYHVVGLVTQTFPLDAQPPPEPTEEDCIRDALRPLDEDDFSEAEFERIFTQLRLEDIVGVISDVVKYQEFARRHFYGS